MKMTAAGYDSFNTSPAWDAVRSLADPGREGGIIRPPSLEGRIMSFVPPPKKKDRGRADFEHFLGQN